MPKISGILLDGAGQVINNCTIELRASITTNDVLTQTQAFTVSDDGYYNIDASACIYDVSLIIDGYPRKNLGKIKVLNDSDDGTLNQFLLRYESGFDVDGDKLTKIAPVLTINNDGPDEDGNINIDVGGGLIIDAPSDNKLYARSNGAWTAIGDSLVYSQSEHVEPLIDSLITRENTLYQIPLDSIGFNINENTVVTSSITADNYYCEPKIVVTRRGNKYLIFSCSKLSGKTVLTITNEDKSREHLITLNHFGGPLYHNKTTVTYNSTNKTISFALNVRNFDSSISVIAIKPKCSLIKLESKPNSLNEIINNGRNVTFWVSMQKDALGQAIMKKSDNTEIIFKLDDNVAPGVYIARVFDQYSGMIFEEFVTVK